AHDNDVQPSLAGEIDADICIVGGGYLGLWSAIQLKASESSLKIVLLEQDICGGGPSGRNSGMLLSAWPKPAPLSDCAARQREWTSSGVRWRQSARSPGSARRKALMPSSIRSGGYGVRLARCSWAPGMPPSIFLTDA